MLTLGTTDTIRVANGTTGSIDTTASGMVREDTAPPDTPPTWTPFDEDAAFTTAADNVAVSAPAAGVKNVETMGVHNTHASVTTLITITRHNGTNAKRLWKGTLAPGEAVIKTVEGRWIQLDANGLPKERNDLGRLIAITVLTSGTSFTTGLATRKIRVRLVGGGGGGAGCTSVAAAAAAGGGGGAGSYAEKIFDVAPNTAYAYVVGAAGTGASGAGGNNGTSSTFTVGGTVVTAFFGSGAPVATAATTLTARSGGAAGAVSTNGDINAAGDPGKPGVVLIVATPIVASGPGGSSVFGAGGIGLVAVGNGSNGTGFGAGGGGSATGASAVRTGGNGTAGVVIVEEYS